MKIYGTQFVIELFIDEWRFISHHIPPILLQLLVQGLLLSKLGSCHGSARSSTVIRRTVLLISLDVVNSGGRQFFLSILQNLQLCLFKDALRRLDPWVKSGHLLVKHAINTIAILHVLLQDMLVGGIVLRETRLFARLKFCRIVEKTEVFLQIFRYVENMWQFVGHSGSKTRQIAPFLAQNGNWVNVQLPKQILKIQIWLLLILAAGLPVYCNSSWSSYSSRRSHTSRTWSASLVLLWNSSLISIRRHCCLIISIVVCLSCLSCCWIWLLWRWCLRLRLLSSGGWLWSCGGCLRRTQFVILATRKVVVIVAMPILVVVRRMLVVRRRRCMGMWMRMWMARLVGRGHLRIYNSLLIARGQVGFGVILVSFRIIGILMILACGCRW